MAKIALEITHPSFGDYKLGQVIEIDEKDLTERLKSFSKPYEKAVVHADKSEMTKLKAENAKLKKELEDVKSEMTKLKAAEPEPEKAPAKK